MQIVYTTSTESQQIHVWRMHENGELMLLQIMNIAGQAQPMVAHPIKPFLYVGVRPNFRVITYQINEDGTLIEVGQTPLPGSPTHISTDHYGNFLFCCSYNNACISSSPIGDNGVPLAPIQILNGFNGCHSVNINNDNKILFVPVLQQDRICMFDVHLTGKLTSHVPQSHINTIHGAGPRHMVFHPYHQYVYCINELNSTVDVWQLSNSNDQVKCIQSLDIQPVGFKNICWAADIHLTPDGRYLYTCDRASSTLTIFSINEDNGLLNIKGFQVTEMQPRSFTIDNSGCYLVSAGQKSHHIEVYRIEKKCGLLTPLARYKVGQGPIWVIIYAL